MKLAKYKACICEGSAEPAIIDILMDNDLLIFQGKKCWTKVLFGAEVQSDLRSDTCVKALMTRFP